MNNQILALLASFSLTVPIVSLAHIPASLATSAELNGYFTDDRGRNNGDWNFQTCASLGSVKEIEISSDQGQVKLKKVEISGTEERQIYTWKNAKARYQITWQLEDPDHVRFQAFQSNGKLIVDTQMTRDFDGCQNENN
jgi:hypothetical protein